MIVCLLMGVRIEFEDFLFSEIIECGRTVLRTAFDVGENPPVICTNRPFHFIEVLISRSEYAESNKIL